ncbi:hypothetical protein PAPHI01_2630 [Pancytospora philotis]|nr:hypothetical protein PAPHI01_2630 [Pancytospora philotis]
MNKSNKEDDVRGRRGHRNGDDEDSNTIAQLNTRMDRLHLQLMGGYKFVRYSGDPKKCAEFLEQFKPYEKTWSEEEYLAHVEVSLCGKAKDWFKGAQNRLFTDVASFKAEFMEMLGVRGKSDITLVLEKMRNERLIPGRVEAGLMAYFAIPQTSIPLKDILEASVQDLRIQWARRLKECKQWKEVLRVAREIDEEHTEDCSSRTRNQRCPGKPQDKAESATVKVAETAVKAGEGCYICEGDHYANRCPKRKTGMPKKQEEPAKQEVPKKLSVMQVRKVDERPFITVQIKEKKVWTLLDTGADANFMSGHVARELALPIRTGGSTIILATGKCTASGVTTCQLQSMDGCSAKEVAFQVVDKLECEAIIGIRSMRELALTIPMDGRTGTIFGGAEYKLKEQATVMTMRLEAPVLKEETSTPKPEEASKASKFGEDQELNEQIKRLLYEYSLLSGTDGSAQCRVQIAHEIELKPDAKGVHTRPYRRSIRENEVIAEEIRKMLDRGLIRVSESPYSSPVVLIRKKDGSIRFCVDYRRLNSQTIPKPFPIPNMDELLETVAPAHYYSTLDLEAGYHQIMMSEKDVEKTAFITRDGHYEWLRMPFGLINAPYTFQKIMNAVFRDLLWKCVVVYLDDVLVFSRTKEDHVVHLRLVLAKMAECGFRLNYRKCAFGVQETDFLGFKIHDGQIEMQMVQRTKVMEIKGPSNVSELRSVIGLLSFFRRFIPNFAMKIEPLLRRLKVGNFEFAAPEKQCLVELQEELCRSNGLILPRMELPFVLYTDASGFGIGAALCQVIDGVERVVLWISRKLSVAELNYTTTEKECLAIIWAIKKLKIYLCNEFTIRTDHSALQWLLRTNEPTGRLARWIMCLQEFQYKIEHVRGRDNLVADALSRGVIKGVEESPQVAAIVLSDLGEEEKLERIARAHEALGHAGAEATQVFLKEKCQWPGMSQDIQRFVKQCAVCGRHAARNTAPATIRIPLGEPFERVGIDIVGPLPKTRRGNRWIIVATDYLTRWAEAAPLKQKSSSEVAKFLMERIILQHGAPSQLLSDQGREFQNECVKGLCKRLKVVKSFTSAYHPQCNGAVERLNRTLIAKLAKICNGRWSDWDEKLPWAVYSYRIAPISRLGCSPFEMLYGRMATSLDDKPVAEGLPEPRSEREILIAIDEFRKAMHTEAQQQRQAEIEKADPNHIPSLKTGDVVMKRRHGFERENKLDDRWAGPYTVTQCFDNGGYEIQNSSGTLYRYNQKDLRLMEGSDPAEWVTSKVGSVLPGAGAVVAFIATC